MERQHRPGVAEMWQKNQILNESIQEELIQKLIHWGTSAKGDVDAGHCCREDVVSFMDQEEAFAFTLCHTLAQKNQLRMLTNKAREAAGEDIREELVILASETCGCSNYSSAHRDYISEQRNDAGGPTNGTRVVQPQSKSMRFTHMSLSSVTAVVIISVVGGV